MSEHLGFIGLGNMGAPMARNLLAAGHTLTVYDISDEAVAPFVDAGAARAESPAAVASAAETVLASLPTPAIVKEVATGKDGISSGNRVKTFIDLSTTGATMAQEIAAALGEHDVTAVDAPVSGGVAGAVKGTVAVMVACPEDQFPRIKAILDPIGKVFFLGDRPGLGQTMKLVNNLLSATALAISSEAMVMGVKAGLDPAAMLDVLNAGTGRNSATEDKFARAILPRTFDLGFTNGLMFKDVKLCLEEAQTLGVPMAVAAAVRAIWDRACSENGEAADFSTIIQCIERDAGVEVKGKD